MTKYFCDKCGTELGSGNSCVGGHMANDRLGTTVDFFWKHGLGVTRKLKVEILTSLDGTSNAGDFCKYCVIDAIKQLDDRPTAAP